MIKTRFTRLDEGHLLKDWLVEPAVLRWFPMTDEREIDDAVRLWINYAKYEASLTAEWNGTPCGMANLNLQPYKKFAHQCILSIIVGEGYRGKGVGTRLMEDLMVLAKDRFKIELLHLEVYQGNPAISLYRRLGFTEFGCQTRFIKDNGEYIGKIFMQKYL